MKTSFSQEFNINPSVIEEYGAIDISLVSDIPLFIDPLLIFNSDNEVYKQLHKNIIRYFCFLSEKAKNNLTEAEIKTWFTFKEVCNNWLGYSLNGNKGSALNMGFAQLLYKNISFVLEDNQITKGKHVEKIMLLYNGNGRDNISDMTVNLIKEFLCEYTEKFARENLEPSKCKDMFVDKVKFNYETESFVSKKYYLPYIINEKGKEEYILLTPKDILREDEPAINKKDFCSKIEEIRASIDNDVLRVQVDNYIQNAIKEYEKEMALQNKQPKEKVINKIKRNSFEEFAMKNPILYDYYIRLKENESEEIKIQCSNEVDEQIEKLIKNANKLSKFVKELGYVPREKVTAKDEAIDRIRFFKHIIEDCDVYKCLYYKGERIGTEDELNRLFRLVWANTNFKPDFETNNGRGEADVVVSKGIQNQCVIEFKLANNPKLPKVFDQADVYCKANNCLDKLVVIFYFTEEEYEKTIKILNKMQVTSLVDKEIFLIDCRNDNKQSGSKL